MGNWLICIILFLLWTCCISQGEITCEPPSIAYGRVRISKAIYQNGERIQISCNDGYKPADRDEATCMQDGWNTRVECIGIVCRQPQIDNGNIQPKQSLYQYQDRIDTFCDEGYDNSVTSSCTARGWQPPPACIPKHCKYPHIQNGEVYEGQGTFPKRPGSRLYFRCNYGFLTENKNTGWQSSYCTVGGWNPEPKCFKQCDRPPQITRGESNYRSRSIYIEGDNITLSCYRGYYLENQQTTTITCTKNGWSPTPICIVPVDAKKCGRPPSIENGDIRDLLKEEYKSGERVIYKCQRFYNMEGNAAVNCQNGHWSDPPKCIEIPRGCQNTPPPNGFFTVWEKEFSINEKVRYKCESGYITPNRVEDQEVQCLQSGWNPEPKCIKACEKPLEPNVDFDENQSFFLSQEILHYQCKDGFQVSKTAVDGHIQCTENGWDSWPVCVAIECDVPIIENGSIEGKEQFANRDVVKFSCNKGYSRVGPDSSQCYHFGWSPQPPVCKETVKTCQQPLSISHGIVVGDLLDEYEHGKKVFYECDIGFVMSGSNTVECVDGEWTSLPSCTDKCRRLEITKFGPRVSLSKQFVNNNMVVKYSCGENLHETTCVNGKWLPEPECTEPCPPPPQLPNAINISERRNYKNGEEIDITCIEHFHLQGPTKISCEHGRWETPPRCIDQRCQNPPSIDNGEVKNSSQNKYLPGETVEYDCIEGFEITGSSFATCGNTKWHRLPACKEKTCGRPPLIDNASFTKNVKNKYQSGETVNYECLPGFAAEGPLILTCQRGEWSEPSTCEDITCREPPVVANGDIVVARSKVYLPGRELHYECHEGFEISGTKTIRCENKAWSEPPTCEDARCPPAPDILHGQLQGNKKQKYLPNEWVQYQCDHGYYIYGSRTITCLKRQWSEEPQCRVNTDKCGRPPSIENGDIHDILKEEYKSGEHVIYKCQRFYNLEGNAVVRCQNGHWSDTPKCIVPCIASPEDMERNNIRLRWIAGDKLYNTDGDESEFTCKWGYRPDPSSTGFRVRCVNGAFEYPRCI